MRGKNPANQPQTLSAYVAFIRSPDARRPIGEWELVKPEDVPIELKTRAVLGYLLRRSDTATGFPMVQVDDQMYMAMDVSDQAEERLGVEADLMRAGGEVIAPEGEGTVH